MPRPKAACRPGAPSGPAKSDAGPPPPCKFFLSPTGCNNAWCTFAHDAQQRDAQQRAGALEGRPSRGRGKGSSGGDPAAYVDPEPCKFFGTPKGCSNPRCPYLHLPSGARVSGKAAGEGTELCKFFGSAKGCSTSPCPFSHDSPNSIPPCSFKQKNGHCDKGEACTYRHVPWSSAEQARAHYASREKGSVEVSTLRYKQLHRDGDKPSDPSKPSSDPSKPARPSLESVEVAVEREIHEETYGSKVMKMMDRMGYKSGGGLGKDGTGQKGLAPACVALEHKSQSAVLGVGQYNGAAKSTAAERAARLADARAHKQPRLAEVGFVQHALLSSDESSDGEDRHVKAHDTQLPSAA